ncbi:hypothetical protein PYW07_007524 [Mythimna separata]|uniref:Reverse transcriptase domain-containing protein n=1 Tax=Mythimna separata TaxID=271217 RepID=A0AAD7Z0R9_MYTSE|nr:hypothetical protein PYW07_007524 [Mythimna separata]
MPGRGTTDAIFAIRQLCEKFRCAHKNLQMVLIDLEKAYNRVHREVLWWALKEKGVPVKYVQLIRAMYSRCSTQVQSTVGTSGSLNVAIGSQPLTLPADRHSGRGPLVYAVCR